MKKVTKYLITLLVGLAIVFAIILSKDIFSQTQKVDIFHILCDASFVAGVLITCAGLLVFSSNEGTFDMLMYGLQSFADLFRKQKLRKYDTFYDYRESKSGKNVPFAFMLVCGLFYIAISLVMLYFYYQYC